MLLPGGIEGMKLYLYVGPPELLALAANSRPHRVDSRKDLQIWVDRNRGEVDREGYVPATYVVAENGGLYLADRRSEHVACARGGRVRAAGEIFFEVTSAGLAVARVSNQSTGYCPPVETWPVVENWMKSLQLESPSFFDPACEFRRCDSCENLQIWKEHSPDCLFCDRPLADHWNVGNAEVCRG